MPNTIKVRCPATSANLGSGFDIFGLALKEPHDILEVEKTDEGIEISASGFKVPTEPEKNTGGYVAIKMMKDFKLKGGLKIKIRKGIKPGSGLGSSAATAAGVAYSINRLFNLGLGMEDLVRYAAQGEIVSAGVAHMDNVAPAIYGWFTIVASRDPLRIYSIKPPIRLGIVIIVPEGGKESTKKAREVLPENVSLEKAVQNIAYASTLAVGMAIGDINMIKAGMEDAIVEPARAEAGILKAFKALKKEAKRLDVGLAASGAGPAVLAITEPLGERANEVLSGLGAVLRDRGINYSAYITTLGSGVREFRD